jgi:hypothetical protein
MNKTMDLVISPIEKHGRWDYCQFGVRLLIHELDDGSVDKPHWNNMGGGLLSIWMCQASIDMVDVMDLAFKPHWNNMAWIIVNLDVSSLTDMN